jgi:hypothetical protein
MTLSANSPTDQELVSSLPAFIRENRVAINAVTVASGFGYKELDVAFGVTSLTVGIDLLAVGFEIVLITGTGVATLATILGGTSGQVKALIFQDSNVSLTDGEKADGKFYLNHLPALSDFAPSQDDVLVIVNVGGDGASVYGYWKELYRSISVK